MGILRISTRNKLSFTHPTLRTAIIQLYNVRWVRRQNWRPVQRYLYPRIDSPNYGEPLVKTTKNHGPIIIIYPSQDTLVNELTGTTPFTTSSASPSSPRIVVLNHYHHVPIQPPLPRQQPSRSQPQDLDDRQTSWRFHRRRRCHLQLQQVALESHHQAVQQPTQNSRHRQIDVVV